MFPQLRACQRDGLRFEGLGHPGPEEVAMATQEQLLDKIFRQLWEIMEELTKQTRLLQQLVNRSR